MGPGVLEPHRRPAAAFSAQRAEVTCTIQPYQTTSSTGRKGICKIGHMWDDVPLFFRELPRGNWNRARRLTKDTLPFGPKLDFSSGFFWPGLSDELGSHFLSRLAGHFCESLSGSNLRTGLVVMWAQ